MLLVRRLNLERWLGPKPAGFGSSETPIEVFAREKLVANELSFWTALEPSESELQAVATALAAAPKTDEISALDLVWLDADAVTRAGIALHESQGETRIPDLASRHRDACQLDIRRFAELAALIAEGVKAQHTCRLVRDEVAELLAAAVDNGRLARGVNLGKKINDALEEARKRRTAP